MEDLELDSALAEALDRIMAAQERSLQALSRSSSEDSIVSIISSCSEDRKNSAGSSNPKTPGPSKRGEDEEFGPFGPLEVISKSDLKIEQDGVVHNIANIIRCKKDRSTSESPMPVRNASPLYFDGSVSHGLNDMISKHSTARGFPTQDAMVAYEVRNYQVLSLLCLSSAVGAEAGKLSEGKDKYRFKRGGAESGDAYGRPKNLGNPQIGSGNAGGRIRYLQAADYTEEV